MEDIIKKAIEGGYKSDLEIKQVSDLGIYGYTKSGNKYPINNSASGIILDPEFWRALGKACGWSFIGTSDIPQTIKPEYFGKAMRFHEINLTQGLSEAVAWLNNLIKKQ